MAPEANGPRFTQRLPSVEVEVRGLLSLVHRGESPAQVRELIGVPAHLEARLRVFGARKGNAHIRHVLDFRRQVLEVFDQLLSEDEASLLASADRLWSLEST